MGWRDTKTQQLDADIKIQQLEAQVKLLEREMQSYNERLEKITAYVREFVDKAYPR